eukprot:TRINITY_DN22625_c0_g1_i2.p1 TRINITY_DN22625_c0_g1~~TRINITY_DN22625_c0_g1_i2.p1  ORF type:complete len:452 (+),score=104.06 TRINITY_DN22625_c0_g1_i2:44-1357(+)
MRASRWGRSRDAAPIPPAEVTGAEPDAEAAKRSSEESETQTAELGYSRPGGAQESRWRREERGSALAVSVEKPSASGSRSLVPSSAVMLRSGLQVPVLGLGTRQLKAGDECREAVRAALRCGYRLLDTAPGYGNEEDIGIGIKAAGLKREDVFIVSKLAPSEHGEVEEVEEALKGTLKRLGTSYVDLYLVQSPKGGSIIWTWDAMLEMRSRGLTRAAGVSNFGVTHLRNLKCAGREVPEVNQVELHFAMQQHELASYCRAEEVVVMAACPLARGRLFRAPSAQTKAGHAAQTIAGLAAKRGRTEAELALRWCLQRGYIAIPKSKDAKRIEANAPFGFSLSAMEMEEIDALDCGLTVSDASKCLDIPWEQAVGEVSEVSDGDVGGDRAPRRKRRGRRRKGKGKGKTGGASQGTAQAGKGSKGGGNAASRAAAVLFSLS